MAEALNQLNKLTVTNITSQNFVATAGQKTFTLAAAPGAAGRADVNLSGAELRNPNDYSLAGSTITLSYPAVAGEVLSVRVFS
jgi:hypothetical protein